MTREEAIVILNNDISACLHGTEWGEALDMAIKALEQEPCDDATLKDIFCMGCEYKEQEPKTGHWIEKDGFDGDVYYDCSECGESWTTIEGTPWQNGMAYCPNCGCRMVEPQESMV